MVIKSLETISLLWFVGDVSHSSAKFLNGLTGSSIPCSCGFNSIWCEDMSWRYCIILTDIFWGLESFRMISRSTRQTGNVISVSLNEGVEHSYVPSKCLPSCPEMRVAPSGLLSSNRNRPTGSFDDGICAFLTACQIMLLSWEFLLSRSTLPAWQTMKICWVYHLSTRTLAWQTMKIFWVYHLSTRTLMWFACSGTHRHSNSDSNHFITQS